MLQGKGKDRGYYTHELIDIDMPNHPAMSGMGNSKPSITRSSTSSASHLEAREYLSTKASGLQ